MTRLLVGRQALIVENTAGPPGPGSTGPEPAVVPSSPAQRFDLDRRTALKTLLTGLALPTLPSWLHALSAAPFSPAATSAVTSAATSAVTSAAASTQATAVFSATQRATLEALCDRMLPRTDTPGALDVGVPQFVARLAEHWFLPNARAELRRGLDTLETQAKAEYGENFAGVAPEQQDALMSRSEDEAFGARQGRPYSLQPESAAAELFEGLRFFDIARWSVLVGYFTSEEGMKREMHYVVVPGSYSSCAPLEA